MKEITEMLTQLADKLGMTVASLWPHAVRYVALSALFNLLTVTGALGLSALWFWRVRKSDWIGGKYGDSPTQKIFAAAALGITLLLFIMTIGTNLTVIFEPTGYLVRQLLKV